MPMTDLRRCGALGLTFVLAGCQAAPSGPSAPSFDVVEASIAEIHAAMNAGSLTSRALVEAYLARIEAYDKHGPALNAILTINPNALARADELDAAWEASGLTGPLHGIPVIVKDNYDTFDLPTSGGSLALVESMPPDDAFQVRRVREAGGIVLAKSNMAEFAFSPYETVGSALPGYTRNPYATNRVTAGSSGGTAAAVAASFGAVGLGTDTGNSIRGPSAHLSLAGIRSTMGLTSRDGIVPLNLSRDIGGPMARTVADAVAVFDVIAGTDPADPATEEGDARRAESYLEFLEVNGLLGKRLGVLREMSDDTADPGVIARFDEAIEDLRRLGATVVDPVALPNDDAPEEERLPCSRFRYDLEQYLDSLGSGAPVKKLQEIVDSRNFHPSIRPRLESALETDTAPADQPGCAQRDARDARLRRRVRQALEGDQLDALVYPTWDNPPRRIGDLNTPHGNNSFQLSPPTGFPAITVPMGFVSDGLPVGLQLLGDAWSEPTLIAIAYAYEQGTWHRVPPPTTPPLDEPPRSPSAYSRGPPAWVLRAADKKRGGVDAGAHRRRRATLDAAATPTRPSGCGGVGPSAALRLAAGPTALATRPTRIRGRAPSTP